MNVEVQAGAAKNESEEKQTAFQENADRAAAIQQEIAEAAASGDFTKIQELSAEGQQLKSLNESVVDADREEAKGMDAEFNAEKARAEEEAAKKAAEEAAAEQARFVQEVAEKAVADQSAAEKLAEEIKSGVKMREEGSGDATQENSRVDDILKNARLEAEDFATRMTITDPEKINASKLLHERKQLVSALEQGGLNDEDRVHVQERIAEIDENSIVLGSLQGEAGQSDSLETWKAKANASRELAGNLLSELQDVENMFQNADGELRVHSDGVGSGFTVEGNGIRTPEMKQKLEEFLGACEKIITTVPGLEGHYDLGLVISKASDSYGYSAKRFLNEVRSGLERALQVSF